MKKKGIIAIVVIVIVIIVTIGIWFVIEAQKKAEQEENQNKEVQMPEVENVVIDKNQVDYQDTVGIEALKQNAGMTGDNEIYEVKTEYDGRKTLAVKPSVQYQVALEDILEKEGKQEIGNGIWIPEQTREALVQMLNTVSNLTYQTDENGFLRVNGAEEEQELDKVLKERMQKEKQTIITMNGEIQIIDVATGQKEIYPFESMDAYQAYDYVTDNDHIIICLTQNKQKKLDTTEIINSMISVLKSSK